MFGKVGFERILVGTALVLAQFPSWHPSAIFFTASDFAFCLSLLAIVLVSGVPSMPLGALTPYWIAGFIALAAWLIASSLVNGDPLRALIVCSQYLFSFVLLPLTIMGRDKESTINLIQIFVTGSFLVNLLSLILYYSGYTGDLHFVTGNGRLASFTGGANGHAQTLALALPLVIYLWLAGRMAMYYFVPVLFTLIVALILTSSNGGLAMTVLGLAGLFLALRNLRYLAQAGAAMAACLVLVLIWGSYWLPEIFEQRVMSAVRGGDIEEAGTFEDRMSLILESLQIVDDTMLLGLGADQYRVQSRYGAPVHNTFLLLWTEGGFPAMIGWLTLLMIALFGSLVIGRRVPLEAATSFALALVFTAVGFVTAHVYSWETVVPLHLGLALVFAAAAEVRGRGALPQRPLEAVHRGIPYQAAGPGRPGPAAPSARPGARG